MTPSNIMATNHWPVQFQFSDTNGVANQISVSFYPLDYTTNWVTLYAPQYNGLKAAVANCTVAATATPINQGYQTPATVSQLVQLACIPIFQFGVYYNMDMDFSPGQPMIMNGKTFVNGNIWMYPQNTMTFNGSVVATLMVTNADNPNDQQALTSYTTPTYNFTDNGGKPLSKADSVSLPIGGPNSNATNVEAILNIPPAGLEVPNSAGYLTTNFNTYKYNQSILIISNSVSGTNGNSVWGTNLSIFFDDAHTYTLTMVTNDVQWTNAVPVTITNPVNGTLKTNINWYTNKFYSFVTNVTFFDFREQDIVQAVQIDVNLFNIWLTNTLYRVSGSGTNLITNYVAGAQWNNQSFNDNNQGIDSIYVYNSVSGATVLPAVRVINGYQMPYSTNAGVVTKGLTVATPFPLYVLGNYNIQTNSGGSQSINMTNTAWAYPAALMGDSITILSGNWSDTNSLARSSYNPPESTGENGLSPVTLPSTPRVSKASFHPPRIPLGKNNTAADWKTSSVCRKTGARIVYSCGITVQSSSCSPASMRRITGLAPRTGPDTPITTTPYPHANGVSTRTLRIKPNCRP